jgi:ABC-2 type transport system permease protein
MTAPLNIAVAEGARPVPHAGRLDAVGYLIALGGIVRRELLRFFNQKERFFSALVRPLVWLFIFAAGFRNTLGVSITPPYETYVLYEVYVVPGLAVMIQLFNGMQSSLSMVYDREVGSMKVLLTSPYPRWMLLFLSSLVRQLENFASVMNFVIFPMFFASSALYPLWRIRESSDTLYWICQANPFTHAVELVRFALYGKFEPLSFVVVIGTGLLFFTLAVIAYDPGRGIMARRGGPAGETP